MAQVGGTGSQGLQHWVTWGLTPVRASGDFVLKDLPAQEMQVPSLGQEGLLEKEMTTPSSILA